MTATAGMDRSPAGVWATPRRQAFLIVLAAILIFLLQGFSVADLNYPLLFRQILSHHVDAIEPRFGYLLEGLVPTSLGLLFVQLGLGDLITQVLWAMAGMAVLLIALIVSVSNRSISAWDLLLIVFYSRLVDTLSIYIGKFDPFLVAFLVLSANTNRTLAGAGTVLAGFTHPIVAVLSSVGMTLISLTWTGRWSPWPLALTVASAAIDFAAFHVLFPGLSSRSGFVAGALTSLLESGLAFGAATLLSAFVVPVLSMQYFKAPAPVVNRWSGALLCGWALCVCAIACALTLDHTRVACLLTLAPLITLLRLQGWRRERFLATAATPLLVLVSLSRLVIPHITGGSAELASWGSLKKVLGLLHI